MIEQFEREKNPTPEKKESQEYQEWQEARAETDKICKEVEDAVAAASTKEEKKEIEENYSGQLLDAMRVERHAAEKAYENIVELYRDDEEEE